MPQGVLGPTALERATEESTASGVEIAIPYFPPKSSWITYRPLDPRNLARLAAVALEE